MITIIKASEKDSLLLSEIGKTSFIESHGHSASEADINDYVRERYSIGAFESELKNESNIYHIIYYNKQAAGYSKMVFSVPHARVPGKNVTKLERLYLLKEYYGTNSGPELFNCNVHLSKQANQAGMWLFVWKENHRAVRFYTKLGFKIVGSYDFKLTETHSNPNHQMFLAY